IGEVFLEAYQEKNPNDDVLKLDLYNIELPYIDTDVFNGWGKLQKGNAFDQLSGDEQLKVSKINDLTDQFIAADKYVFVTPF
ncbi:NAD(P)H-dependent oxidoreductase, partial [Micrococcus sp. SIMBA_131]